MWYINFYLCSKKVRSVYLEQWGSYEKNSLIRVIMVISWNIDGWFGISGFNEELYVVI